MSKRKAIFVSLLSLFGMFGLMGCSGNSPYIGENGNWWVGESDLGVPATGEKGEKGDAGPKGDQGEKGDAGEQGEQGEKGDGITVSSVEKIRSEGKNDIYQITFSDGTTAEFTVTNGTDGSSISVTDICLKSSENGTDTYEITFSNGYTTTFTVENGKDLTVVSIEKVSSEGLFDTYRISYSDGNYVEFVVSNGASPYIGDNGNWWIGETDTGVQAGSPKKDERIQTENSKISSAGLVYTPMTINGVSGLVITDYDSSIAKKIALNNYFELSNGLSKTNFGTYVDNILDQMDIIIPNYVGETPVIGVGERAFYQKDVRSISLSKNTIYFGDEAFSYTTSLESFDFNGSKISYISDSCFYQSSIKNISLPESVTSLYDKAFYECELENLDFSKVTYFGESCLNGLQNDYVWLDKHVKYVGKNAFNKNFVYVEHGTDTSGWNDSGTLDGIISGTYYKNIGVIKDCYKADNLIYAYNAEDGVTAYKWLENGKEINVPSMIDNKSITRIGYGFANDINRVTRAKDEGEFSTDMISVESVVLPSTVKKIERGAIQLYGAMIYIPSSVEEIYASTCIYDTDDIGLSYLAYESSDLPTFTTESEESNLTADEWLDKGFGDKLKYGLGLDFTKIKYSDADKTYYYEDDLQVTILNCVDLKSEKIEIPGTFNSKPIKTIGTRAYARLSNLKVVKIGDNVTRLQKKAFDDLSLSTVFISSVTSIIGKYAFNDCCDTFYIASSTLPDDWDSYWSGSKTHNVKYKSNISNLKFGESQGYLYFTFGVEATLYSSDIESTAMVLPSDISGLPVTSLAYRFSENSDGKKIYIPNSIVSASTYSFSGRTSSSSKADFYFETNSIPSGFESNWFGKNSSSYASYNQTMPKTDYDLGYIYLEESDSITLLSYIGDETTVRIPRMINEKSVTQINANFINSSKTMKFYIPKSVSTIKSYAFTSTSSDLWWFCFEASSGSDGYYNSKSNYYKIDLYNQTLNY